MCYEIQSLCHANCIVVGVVTTLAGSGNAAFADGAGTLASFNYPTSVAIDPHGNVFVADAANSRIRMISPAGKGVMEFRDSLSITLMAFL